MPFFSVIIPTFNRALLLRYALESVWAQGFTDYEIIVIDDGSTDGTQEYLSSLGNQVACLSQSNQGPGAARNFGVRHAKGDYLAFLDSDDLWFPWSLEIYAEVIGRENGPAFIAGKPKLFKEPVELCSVGEEPLVTKLFADYYTSGDEWRWWGVSSFVIRREAFTAVGGFINEWVNGEDADLALRLGVAPGFVQVISPATFAYREHEASAMNNLPRTLAGAWLQVRTERSGGYPGGVARATERRRILTRHMRPVTIGCLQRELQHQGWALYRATFPWNAALGRVRYVVGFPLLAAMSKLHASKAPELSPIRDE